MRFAGKVRAPLPVARFPVAPLPLLACFLACLFAPVSVRNADWPFLDALFRARHAAFGQRQVNPYLVFAYDDDGQAGDTGNDGGDGASAADARRVAALVNALGRLGARAVALDVFFREPSATSLLPLADAIARSVPVVLPTFTLPNGIAWRYPELLRAPPAIEGNVSRSPDADGRVRAIDGSDDGDGGSVRAIDSRDGGRHGGIADGIAARLIGAAGRTPRNGGAVLLDYPGPSAGIAAQYRIDDLVAYADPSVPVPSRLKMEFDGAMVIVGDASTAGKDFVATPFETMMPASLLIILESDALLSPSPLREAGIPAQALCCAAMALALAVIERFVDRKKALAYAAVTLALAGASFAAFCALRVYLWGGAFLAASALGAALSLASDGYREATLRREYEIRLARAGAFRDLGKEAAGLLHSLAGSASIGKAIATKALRASGRPDERDLLFLEKAFAEIEGGTRDALGKIRARTLPEAAEVDLGSLMATVAECASRRAPFVRYFGPDRPARVVAVEGELALAFANLANNAIEAVEAVEATAAVSAAGGAGGAGGAATAAAEPPSVAVGVTVARGMSAARGTVRVTVTDNGTGIAACYHCLFRDCLSCGRLPAGFSTKKNGNGFGLSQVRDAIRMCGGALSVSSSPRGTAVRVTIPLAGGR